MAAAIEPPDNTLRFEFRTGKTRKSITHPQSQSVLPEVFVEFNGSRLEVSFRYNPVDVAKVKTIAGKIFHGESFPKYWSVPLTQDAGSDLRRLFGDRLRFGPVAAGILGDDG